MRPVGVKSFHAEWQGRHDEVNSRFRSFVHAPNKAKGP